MHRKSYSHSKTVQFLVHPVLAHRTIHSLFFWGCGRNSPSSLSSSSPLWGRWTGTGKDLHGGPFNLRFTATRSAMENPDFCNTVIHDHKSHSRSNRKKLQHNTTVSLSVNYTIMTFNSDDRDTASYCLVNKWWIYTPPLCHWKPSNFITLLHVAY